MYPFAFQPAVYQRVVFFAGPVKGAERKQKKGKKRFGGLKGTPLSLQPVKTGGSYKKRGSGKRFPGGEKKPGDYFWPDEGNPLPLQPEQKTGQQKKHTRSLKSWENNNNNNNLSCRFLVGRVQDIEKYKQRRDTLIFRETNGQINNSFTMESLILAQDER